ncbi:MAG: hypothetical protein N2C14_01575 [Planctomycetales bacterium]
MTRIKNVGVYNNSANGPLKLSAFASGQAGLDVRAARHAGVLNRSS